jgi:hypothetical protein
MIEEDKKKGLVLRPALKGSLNPGGFERTRGDNLQSTGVQKPAFNGASLADIGRTL